VDKAKALQMLLEGTRSLGVPLGKDVGESLLRFSDELARWNSKVNLTAIRDPGEVLEKHFVDSLAVFSEVKSAAKLLDIGSGGGFPGIPLKLAVPGLDVTLVESSSRKVAFLKHALVALGLQNGIRAVEARAEGEPGREGIPLAEVVISRALHAPEEWVKLAERYLSDEGRVIAMLGSKWSVPQLESIAKTYQGTVAIHSYRLPFSGARRAFAVFRF